VLGGNVFGWTADEATSFEILDAYVSAGGNCIDTADVYSRWAPGHKGGESETVIGKWLKKSGKRDKVVVATKVGMDMGDGKQGLKPAYIRRAVEESLQRLQTDHIDLYQIHGNDPVTPVEETLHALDTLVRSGKVRYIGCSNWQAWKIAKALGISSAKNLARFDTLQAYYSVAGRDLERELVPMMESEKVGLLVWSPLAGGLLSDKFSRTRQKPEDSRRSDFDFPIVDKERVWKILDVMAPMAKAHECSSARVALAWLRAKPVVTSVIIGAKRLDQLKDNIAAVELTLTEDELKQLDEVSTLPVEYPGWMLPFQAADRLAPVDRWALLRKTDKAR
jgi:aryl-alcohol dehydrogenase-like predicted oxidoreductase